MPGVLVNIMDQYRPDNFCDPGERQVQRSLCRWVWQAIKLGFLWGLAIQVVAIALGRVSLFQVEKLAVNTALTLFGAVLITVGVFYLARLLRRR